MNNAHFNFFIAYKHDHQDILKSRFRLIKKMEIYEVDKLVRITKDTKPSESLVSELVKYAKTEHVILDEFEKAILFYCWYVSRKKFTDDEVIKYSHTLQCLMFADSNLSKDEFKKKYFKLIDSERQTMIGWCDGYKRIDFPKIRAKIALIEFAAVFEPDYFLPVLIDYSLEYLKSDFAINWIKKNRFDLFKSKSKKSDATKNKLLKSIWGDGNTKARIYEYWRLHAVYAKLENSILGLRSSLAELNKAELNIFYKANKIPSNYETLILDKRVSAKHITLEVMTANKMIKDPKSFKEFQSLITKLHKKHFGTNMASIEHEFMPHLFRFLDIPSKIPQDIKFLDIYDQLQHIEMT